MFYSASVTSQGQVSIPIKLRRQYGLNKAQKVVFEATADGITMRPQADIDSLMGSFKTKKRIPWKTVRKMLDEAWARGEV